MSYFECEPIFPYGKTKIHATWAGTTTKCGRKMDSNWDTSSLPFVGGGYRYCQRCVKAVDRAYNPPARKYPKLEVGHTYRLILTSINTNRAPWSQTFTVRESGQWSAKETIIYVNRQCALGKNTAKIEEVAKVAEVVDIVNNSPV